MPVYVDSEGTRYWFDAEPEPGVHRADLVLAPPEPLPLQDTSGIVPETS